jgi:hypothetical protein
VQRPEYLEPFVVSPDPVEPERRGALDLYRPAAKAGGARPAVVLVHGGPVPEGLAPTPRDWPV